MRTLTDILIIALFCNGIYLITRQGMILFFIHKAYVSIAGGIINADSGVAWSNSNKVLTFIYKPLFGCLPCMASIWGSIAYFGLGNSLSFIYPIAIIAVACVNLLVNRLYDE